MPHYILPLTTALWLPLQRSTLTRKRCLSPPLTRSRNQPKRSLQPRREFDGNQTSPQSMRLRRKGYRNPRLPLYSNKENMPPKNARGVPTVVSGTEINWSIGSSPCTNYMPSTHTVSLVAQVRGSSYTNPKGLFFKIQADESPPALQNRSQKEMQSL